MPITPLRDFIGKNFIQIILAVTTVLISISAVLHSNIFIESDGYCYYHITKSIIHEGNFVSETEPDYWPYMGHAKETYNGKYVSACAPGHAIIHLPGIFLVNILQDIQIFDGHDFVNNHSGHSLWEGVSVLITSTLLVMGTTYLIFKSLQEINLSKHISAGATIIAIITAYFPLNAYAGGMFPQATEAFLVSTLTYLLVKEKGPDSDWWIRFLWLGLLGGLLVLTKPIHVLTLMVFIVGMIFKSASKDLVSIKTTKNLIYTIIGGAPSLILYLAYNYISYGSLIVSGYAVIRSESFIFEQFNGLNLIFTPYNGWLVFHPIIIIVAIGLFMLLKKNRIISVVSLVSIAIGIIVYGFWPTWWSPGSYGTRFLLYTLPFQAIAIGMVLKELANFSQIKKWGTIFLICASILYALILTFAYPITDFGGAHRNTPVYLLRSYLDNRGNYLEKVQDITIREMMFDNPSFILVNESRDGIYISYHSLNGEIDSPIHLTAVSDSKSHTSAIRHTNKKLFVNESTMLGDVNLSLQTDKDQLQEINLNFDSSHGVHQILLTKNTVVKYITT